MHLIFNCSDQIIAMMYESEGVYMGVGLVKCNAVGECIKGLSCLLGVLGALLGRQEAGNMYIYTLPDYYNVPTLHL